MARKAAALGLADSPSKSMYDYQCEEDVRTLTRAAEVMADTGRARAAMKKFKRQRVGADKLIGALGHNGKGY